MAPTLLVGAQPLLGPLVSLCSWTLAMEAWMYATRMPALSNSGLEMKPTMTKEDMNSVIPPETRWKADNYNHLMEQPTQFYATTLALVALGANDRLTVGLAWGYVGLRVVHSLVQALTNKIMVRFSIFGVSSVALLGLTVKAASLLL